MNKRAVFLDRDGVINEVFLKKKKPVSPHGFEEFRFMKGISGPLEQFRKLGFLNIIVTNQPDIARGLLDIRELEKMHKKIKDKLPIDDIRVCPHDDKDMCACRKPKPGLLIKAAEDWGVELARSYVIGDSRRDIEAGKRAGCITVLLNKRYNNEDEIDSDFRVRRLSEFAKILKNREV